MALPSAEVGIVHRRAFQRTVGQRESAGFDDVDLRPQAGSQPHRGAQILGYVGLIESQAHFTAFPRVGASCDIKPRASCGSARYVWRTKLRIPWESRVAEHGSDSQSAGGAHAGETRRDFIHIAAVTVAGGGAAALAWPFLQQLGPAADTRALSSTEVDVSKVPLGGEIRILIGGMPFFVRHRTDAEIQDARNVDVSTLRDPQTDDDRLQPKADGTLNPAILVTSGSCTHLGCVPVGPAQGTLGDFGGWYCPCHGSHYDTSGRIRKGPAPLNLPVPKYEYTSDSIIKISL